MKVIYMYIDVTSVCLLSIVTYTSACPEKLFALIPYPQAPICNYSNVQADKQKPLTWSDINRSVCRTVDLTDVPSLGPHTKSRELGAIIKLFRPYS